MVLPTYLLESMAPTISLKEGKVIISMQNVIADLTITEDIDIAITINKTQCTNPQLISPSLIKKDSFIIFKTDAPEWMEIGSFYSIVVNLLFTNPISFEFRGRCQ